MESECANVTFATTTSDSLANKNQVFPFLNNNNFRKPTIFQHSRDIQYGLVSRAQRTHNVIVNKQIIQRYQIVKHLKYHAGCVNALSFNESGTLLLSGSDDTRISIWDPCRGTLVSSFDSQHVSNVFQVRVMANSSDRAIISSDMDGSVRISHLDHSGNFQSSHKLHQHFGPCHKVLIEKQNPSCVLTCGEDAIIRRIDLRDNCNAGSIKVCNLSKRRVPLYSISERPGKEYEIVTCGIDAFLRVYDLRFAISGSSSSSKGPLMTFKASAAKPQAHVFEPYVTSVQYSPDGQDFIASYYGEELFLFNANSDENPDAIQSYCGHRNRKTIKGVNYYGPRGEYIISGSDCGHVFIWEKKTGNIVWFDRGDQIGVVNVVQPHPSFPIIATSGFDNDVKVWEPTRPECKSLDNFKEASFDVDRTIEWFEYLNEISTVRIDENSDIRQIGLNYDSDEDDHENFILYNGVLRVQSMDSVNWSSSWTSSEVEDHISDIHDNDE